MGIGAAQVGFLAGGWLGRVPSLPSSRPPHFVRLMPHALFGILHIAPQITLRHRENLGVPLNHPRFLEWIGVPESASLLEMGPGRWLNMSRDKAVDAAIQLHRDVCLMTTNLNILDQYALALQGPASEMLEVSLGSGDFPSADVAAVPWGLESAALPFRWRLWVCGDPRWTRLFSLEALGSECLDFYGLMFH